MKTLPLKSHFLNFSNPNTSTKLNTKPPSIVPTQTTSKLKTHQPNPTKHAKTTLEPTQKATHLAPKNQEPLDGLSRNLVKATHFAPKNQELLDGLSRNLVLGTVSIGVVMLLMGIDEHSRALAWGPEGPLLEDFWDNMRRYGLYALTVSTGVLYAVFEPIVQLLKNPISAILIITILGGGVFIVSQVVSAMIGVNEFSYEYSY